MNHSRPLRASRAMPPPLGSATADAAHHRDGTGGPVSITQVVSERSTAVAPPGGVEVAGHRQGRTRPATALTMEGVEGCVRLRPCWPSRATPAATAWNRLRTDHATHDAAPGPRETQRWNTRAVGDLPANAHRPSSAVLTSSPPRGSTRTRPGRRTDPNYLLVGLVRRGVCRRRTHSHWLRGRPIDAGTATTAHAQLLTEGHAPCACAKTSPSPYDGDTTALRITIDTRTAVSTRPLAPLQV